MKTSFLRYTALLSLVGVLCLPIVAMAQTAPLSHRMEPYALDTGLHSAPPNQAADVIVYTTIVEVPDAPWLRLNFSHANLGSGSYITVTSRYDDAQQDLDAAALAQWQNTSAYFNGDALEVELHLASGDTDVFVEMSEIMVGQPDDSFTQCGPTDDRVPSSDDRAGRLLSIGCTAWLIADGRFVSAGHCTASAGSTNTVQFNVPLSTAGGVLQHPGPEDQYTVDDATINSVNGGVGNDWGVFETFPNTTTGLTAIQAQGAWFDLVQDLGPPTIRITGYGVDSGTANQTQQTHAGPNAGSSGTTMRYQTDTQGGNSGSPVIDEVNGVAVGVHTHGGCTSGGGNNNGTSTFNTAFWAEVGDVGGDPISLTVTTQINRFSTKGRASLDWTPFDGAPDKVDVLRNGVVVRRTRDDGNTRYNENPLPVGSVDYQVCDGETGECSNVETVTFGTIAGMADWTDEDEIEAEHDVESSNVAFGVPETTELIGAYPNPFNPTSTITYALADRGMTELSVYNTLGQRVALLVSSVQDAGSHDAQFNASSLPSGVYVYALRTGEELLTGRLMLVK